jgi:hypothetical protein
MQAKDLRDLFVKSGFIYPGKLVGLNLELALENIVRSYKGPDHMYLAEYGPDGRLTAHLALLQTAPKTWMGHHHCSTNKGAGARLFIRFAEWVYNNQGHAIDHLYAYYRRNGAFYEEIYDAVNDGRLCNLSHVGHKGNTYPEDETYGLNLSHWHKPDNISVHPGMQEKVYTRWYFRCTDEAIQRSFKFFKTLI